MPPFSPWPSAVALPSPGHVVQVLVSAGESGVLGPQFPTDRAVPLHPSRNPTRPEPWGWARKTLILFYLLFFL